MNDNYIYLDWAASAPLRPEIKKILLQSYDDFANPSSIHAQGRQSYNSLKEATKNIARLFECKENEIIFTSGATESNNLAILGTIAKQINQKKPIHLITGRSEHSSVYEVFKYLESQGAKVTYLPTGKNGQIRISDLEKSFTKNTLLVSITAASNEIGAINPISKITKIVKKFNPNIKVHTDAAQYAIWNKFNAAKLGADLITISPAKMGGPHGTGILIARGGDLHPIFYGGKQQNSIRPGTENLAGIITTQKTLELAWKNLDKKTQKVKKLRDTLQHYLLKNYSGSFANNPKNGLPNILSITFPGVRGIDLVYALDAAGVGVATGSACSEKNQAVIKRELAALGLSSSEQLSTIRISLGRDTTAEEIELAGKIIIKTAKKLHTEASDLDILDNIGKKIAKKYAK